MHKTKPKKNYIFDRKLVTKRKDLIFQYMDISIRIS